MEPLSKSALCLAIRRKVAGYASEAALMLDFSSLVPDCFLQPPSVDAMDFIVKISWYHSASQMLEYRLP